MKYQSHLDRLSAYIQQVSNSSNFKFEVLSSSEGRCFKFYIPNKMEYPLKTTYYKESELDQAFEVFYKELFENVEWIAHVLHK